MHRAPAEKPGLAGADDVPAGPRCLEHQRCIGLLRHTGCRLESKTITGFALAGLKLASLRD